MSLNNIESYKLGLLDAIDCCEAEMECRALEYPDGSKALLYSKSSIINCIALIKDRIETLGAVKQCQKIN